MHRLFVALRPPAVVRARLLALMQGVEGARWQDDAQLHLTLRFIGEVDRRQAEDVAQSLSALVAPAPEVQLAGAGRFERRGRTGALWAGVAPAEPLAALHRKIDRALVRNGLAPEARAYRPHITLARLAPSATDPIEVARWLTAHGGLSGTPFRLDHLILYESHVGRHGADYAPVARWALGGG